MQDRFWEHKTLSAMSRQEWEALCDGCGKCCLHKLEDEDTGRLYYTSVVCRYFDEKSCRCQVYEQRRELVPSCLDLKQEDLDKLYFMPETCAYRRLHEGKKLPAWHPLLNGGSEAMLEAGHCIAGKVLSETHVHADGLDEHIIRWVK